MAEARKLDSISGIPGIPSVDPDIGPREPTVDGPALVEVPLPAAARGAADEANSELGDDLDGEAHADLSSPDEAPESRVSRIQQKLVVGVDSASRTMLILFAIGFVAFVAGIAVASAILGDAIDHKSGWLKDILTQLKQWAAIIMTFVKGWTAS